MYSLVLFWYLSFGTFLTHPNLTWTILQEKVSNRAWRTSNFDPFASNLAFVLNFCSHKNSYQVGLLLNEKLQTIPGCETGMLTDCNLLMLAFFKTVGSVLKAQIILVVSLCLTLELIFKSATILTEMNTIQLLNWFSVMHLSHDQFWSSNNPHPKTTFLLVESVQKPTRGFYLKARIAKKEYFYLRSLLPLERCLKRHRRVYMSGF